MAETKEEVPNYEEDLEIDPDALDVEWLGQASLYQKYCRLSADADRDVKFVKEKVEGVRAELTLKAHQEGIEGMDKLTEAKVTAWIQTHKDYEKVKSQYIEAEHAAQLLKNAVFAFSQRKSALEYLVQLHGQQYFAGPHLPRNLSGEWEKKMQRTKEDIHFQEAGTRMRRKRTNG